MNKDATPMSSRGPWLWLALAAVLASCADDSDAVGDATVDGPGVDRPVEAGGSDAPPPDGPVGCGLRTCASEHASCGPIGDGCGAVIQCGSCSAPNFCGGGGP